MTENDHNFLNDLLKVFGLILNAFIFFRIVTYTFIEGWWLLLGFVFLMFFGYNVYRQGRFHINQYVYYLIYLPLIFNSFFLVNYLFSTRKKVEHMIINMV